MRKPIFVQIRDVYVRGFDKTEGSLIRAWESNDKRAVPIHGKIRRVIQETHGTLLLCENQGYGKPLFCCMGWPVLPIWVTECGGSGIVAVWKDPNVDALTLLEGKLLRDEAVNSMAL